MIWELWTQESPWAGVPSDFAIEAVRKGETLAIPNEMPQELVEILKGCWTMDAARRWSARRVATSLESLVRKSKPENGFGQPVSSPSDYSMEKLTLEVWVLL